ncbi:aspartate/glutamate racemase family protein [Winogradskya humida]|uniref:Arylsulfatase n=1 Tax=Winogradskya humida TaxID=113566 RepID=A0ABQ3ZLH0_9ACTN|nr:aspartate/glutamate racemase family protein [Actinoplanes humidus]GIE19414.1 hypothetical protein Ahu01nite_025160 [Actinoplanes humidus]
MIGFLHTAPVHVDTFERLLGELGPGVASVHVVDESLLADSARPGVDDRLLARLHEVADAGAKLIVCTCSTLSGRAEQLGDAVGVPVLRVDRPMADAAVAAGPRIGVVFAVESTLAPTRELLDRPGVEIVEAPCLAAWSLFQANDLDGYARSVAACARALDVDVIVLAQASMAPAEILLADLGKPVLTSPRAAVREALLRYTLV